MTEEQLEKAIETHARRRNTFMVEGRCEDQAFELAEQMFNRDQDPYDNRRTCFECTRYVARHCTAYRDRWNKPTMQLRFVLQNCDKFDLRGKK